MSSNSNGIDPHLEFRDNFTVRYDTHAIRDQYLVSTNLSADFRGILTLDEEGEKKNEKGDADRMPMNIGVSFQGVPVGLPWCGILHCATLRLDSKSSRSIHQSYAMLFQEIMKKTGRITEALQAILTLAQQMEYYENSRAFDLYASASYSLAEEKLIPMRRVGFSIVSATCGMHLFLLVVTVIWFVRCTSATCLSNMWMSISQIVCSDTEDMIQNSTRRLDSEVREIILETKSSSSGLGLRQRVRVKNNEENGRDELIRF